MSLLALLPLILAQAQEPAPLLAPVQGWRTERLAFPLSFAPDLPYQGFEDLAFAPGMFEPASESYFSYALAMQFEGEVRVDEAMLAHFLESYYRGLCRAVAGSRGLERDANRVQVMLERQGDEFLATIDMFDPFTTGDDLKLRLVLRSHDTQATTEILGLASPKPADAPIWKELHALATAWEAARAAPLYLNHLFAVVDQDTYRALASSTFLCEQFAVSEERTTVRPDLTYSGLYFYGERTYFEFLPPGAASGSGLALGVERPGALAALAAKLKAADIATQGGPITRQLGDKSVPWFEILGIEMPPSRLSVFGMEYAPGFLQSWHPDQPPSFASIARSDILTRYAATLERTPLRARAPLVDVIAIDLTLSVAERDRLLAFGRSAQWAIEPEANPILCRAPQFQLRLHLWPGATPAPGLTRFSVSLREPIAKDPLTLGRVRITFEGKTAYFDLAH